MQGTCNAQAAGSTPVFGSCRKTDTAQRYWAGATPACGICGVWFSARTPIVDLAYTTILNQPSDSAGRICADT